MSQIKKFLLYSFATCATLLLLSSCSDDEDCCITPPEPIGPRVWVVNEGNFLQGNASLDIFDIDSSTYTTSVFAEQNGRGIGDVLNSITFFENKAYLVVNNSQRIEVIDVETYSSIATISDRVYSPRFAVVVDDKIYVSDFSRSYVYVIDPTTNLVVDSIYTRRSVEELIAHEGKIYASANDFYTPIEYIYVIDPQQSQVVDSIKVGLNPNAMIKDADDMIWAMCDGQYGVGGTEGLYRIDPSTNTIDKSFSFTTFTPAYPARIAVNNLNADHLYLNGPQGIYKVEIGASNLPNDPFLPYSQAFYGIGIHPESNDIYIGDSAGSGSVNVFNQSGTQTGSYMAGAFPGRFYFR